MTTMMTMMTDRLR